MILNNKTINKIVCFASPIIFILSLMVFVFACSSSITPQAERESESLRALATKYLQDGNYGEALRNAKKSVEVNPENNEARLTLATIYAARGELDFAEKELNILVKRDPENPFFLNTLGVVYINKGEYINAVNVLKKSSSNETYVGRHLAYGNLGWAYMELQEYTKANEALNNALREQPNFCVARYRLAQLYYKQHKNEEAFEEIDIALRPVSEEDDDEISDCSKMAEGYHLLGLINTALNKEEDANNAFRKCIELSPQTILSKRCKSHLPEENN